MRIVLVHMPWGTVGIPALGLSIMRTIAERQSHEVEVRWANLDFVDWVVEETGFGIGDYEYYSEDSYFQGVGDWVFSRALYGGEVWPGGDAHYLRFLADNGACETSLATTRTLNRIAPRFIERLADELAASEPDLVGFTSTFQQNTASLAAARMLKLRRPQTRVALGGANCDGVQGATLYRNFDFVDYLVRGEGEVTFPRLLGALVSDETDLATIEGLCWRDQDGAPVINPMSRKPLPPTAIVPPTYDGFFERFDNSVAASWVEPKLVVESSRGCWWGEKHHCTFCGLNGSYMQFRSKPPETFLAELLDLARRHQLLDFQVVDNIMDMGYFDTVLRELAASGYDLRIFYEVKSNLRRHQLQQLGDAGMAQIQPGIESLNTHVLKLMDKGVNGCQNVRTLRDAQSADVTISWNYLYGFPGETDADYRSLIRQFPTLHHLDPPTSTSRIAIERFSPYFNKPELGFTDLVPAPQYRDIYRLPDTELAELAYLFFAPPQGIDQALATDLSDAVDTWTEEYPRSRLTWTQVGERVVLVSERTGYQWSVLELATEPELSLFRLLDQPRTLATLAARVPGGEAAVLPLLRRWIELGIVFTDDERYVQVAVEAHNQVLMRIRNRSAVTEKEARDAAVVG